MPVGVRYAWAETEQGHGRSETRRALVLDDPERLAWLQRHHHWPGLQAIGRIQAERRIGERTTIDDRYYLLSCPLSVHDLLAAVRSHWEIENSLHWVLDVSFHEDQSRIRQGHAPENIVVLRHIALKLLRRMDTKRLSLKAKRKKAGCDNGYLLQVLQGIEMR